MISENKHDIRTHDAIARRYDNMLLYISLVAFLAMSAIFFLILSL